MAEHRVSRVAAGALALFALWVARQGVTYLLGQTSGESFGLRPFLAMVLFAIAAALFAVAVFSASRERPDVAAGVLTGFLVLQTTFYVPFYQALVDLGLRSQARITAGFLVSAIPAVLVALAVRHGTRT